MSTGQAVGAFAASIALGFIVRGWMCNKRKNVDPSRVVNPGNINVSL